MCKNDNEDWVKLEKNRNGYDCKKNKDFIYQNKLHVFHIVYIQFEWIERNSPRKKQMEQLFHQSEKTTATNSPPSIMKYAQ
jgi:hypothetical protein